MPIIKFSEEWDKLKPNERKPGKWFTTFRGYEARKEVYYQNNLNNHFDVHLKGKWLGVVKLINIYCKRASELPLIFWHHDVRSDINRVEVEELMRSFYNNPDPYGLILEFQWVAVQEFLEMEEDIIKPCGCDMDMECEDCNSSLRDSREEEKHFDCSVEGCDKEGTIEIVGKGIFCYSHAPGFRDSREKEGEEH